MTGSPAAISTPLGPAQVNYNSLSAVNGHLSTLAATRRTWLMIVDVRRFLSVRGYATNYGT
jgi:hypothetical protein